MGGDELAQILGLERSRQIRQASTRSAKRAVHPRAGVAHFNVGSIEDDGILYGVITYAFTASTTTTAATIVSAQSIAIRTGRGNRASRPRGDTSII